MADYAITIEFNDGTDAQIVALPGLDLEDAETFTAKVRYEMEEARAVNAPVVSIPADAGPALTLEPDRIISIDLEEIPT